MAETGAHITLTSQDEPSIFDVVAQDALMDSIQPAFIHVVKVLAEKDPQKFGWAYQYSSELFLLLHVLLQHHYLHNYGSSFSENFYDLKRMPLKKGSKAKPPLSLSSPVLNRSLAVLVLFPYVRQTLNKKYQESMEDSEDVAERRWIVGDTFKRVWPYVNFLWEAILLISYVRYLTNKQKFHSPLLYLCGVSLSYLSQEDYDAIEERSQMRSFQNVKSVKEFFRWALEHIGVGLQNSLEVGAFFLQYLDWFYSSNTTPSKLFASNPIPAPPEHSKNVSSCAPKGYCPLCLQPRKQDTVLSISGVVFCYRCILLHIRQHGKCPVTNYPATTKQLIKIYQTS